MTTFTNEIKKLYQTIINTAFEISDEFYELIAYDEGEYPNQAKVINILSQGILT